MSIGNSASNKVSLFVVGAQKSGTTALDFYLRQHPQICMAARKEVHFFDNEKHFTGGRVDYSTYHSFFKPGSLHTICGETTPAYMYWLAAPRRIWEYNPEAKLIVILRNPVERAYSHWNMQMQRGAESRTFWEAIHSERRRCRESLPLQNKPYSYIDRGFYTEQIRRLNHYFPDSRLLITKCEELREKPQEYMSKICRFLSIPSLENIVPVIRHENPYSSPMMEAERTYLQGIFEYEIKQLERMLGWDCSDWLSGS